MLEIEVGKIEGYPVLYLPERDLVFCKNTVLPFKKMQSILHSSRSKHEIPEKQLSITKLDSTVTLGCLITPEYNLRKIEKEICKWKIKTKKE